jgi:SAM-dependent methyltransferase
VSRVAGGKRPWGRNSLRHRAQPELHKQLLGWQPRMSTGEEYLRVITSHESDRRTRRAFHELVLSVAAPGACILDFGCGPGIDAKFYAEQGFQVIAYDVDERMCETFERHCAPEIQARQVELLRGDYRYFLKTLAPMIRQRFDVSLITANFAPLSMIRDLPELFASFHLLARNGAQTVASVLHPYYVNDMLWKWWWTARPRVWRHGVFSIRQQAGEVFRRTVDHYASQAAPHFTLQACVRGEPGPVRHGEGASPLALATSQFMFLLFVDSQHGSIVPAEDAIHSAPV